MTAMLTQGLMIFSALILCAVPNGVESVGQNLHPGVCSKSVRRPIGMVEVEFEEDSIRRESTFQFRRYPSDASLLSQSQAFCNQFRVRNRENCALSLRDSARTYLKSLESLDGDSEQIGVRILSPKDGTTLFETHADDDYATISVVFALVSPSTGNTFQMPPERAYRIEIVFLVDKILAFPLSDAALKGGVSLVITRGYFGSHLFEVRVVDAENQVVVGSATSAVEVLALRSLPMLTPSESTETNSEDTATKTTASARPFTTRNQRRRKVVILSDVGDVMDGTKAVLMQQTDALLRAGIDVEFLDTTGALSTAYGTMHRHLDGLVRTIRDEEVGRIAGEEKYVERAPFGEFTVVRVEMRFELGHWDSVDTFKSSVREELPHISSLADPRFEKFRSVRGLLTYWRDANADALWVTNSKIDESLAVVCHFARLVGGVESRILSIGANALDPNTTALLRSHKSVSREEGVGEAPVVERWLRGMISNVTAPSHTLLNAKVVRASGLALDSFRVTVDLERFDMKTICAAAYAAVEDNATNGGVGQLVDNRRIRRRCDSLSSASDAIEGNDSNTGTVRVLFAGRLVEAKSPGIFLRAAAAIVRHYLSAEDSSSSDGTSSSHRIEFVIVGSGYLKPVLVKLARDLGVADRVIFSDGRVPHSDMPRIFASADIFAFPSIYPESFGIVCIEAMSLGIPVVGFGFGGSPDYLRHMDTGFVASPVTALGFAASIDLLARSPALRRDLGNRAMRLARDGYSAHAAREAWIRLYDGVITRDEGGSL